MTVVLGNTPTMRRVSSPIGMRHRWHQDHQRSAFRGTFVAESAFSPPHLAHVERLHSRNATFRDNVLAVARSQTRLLQPDASTFEPTSDVSVACPTPAASPDERLLVVDTSDARLIHHVAEQLLQQLCEALPAGVHVLFVVRSTACGRHNATDSARLFVDAGALCPRFGVVDFASTLTCAPNKELALLFDTVSRLLVVDEAQDPSSVSSTDPTL